MESVQINVDPKKEEMVPRPDPGEETYELAKGILAEAEDRLLDDYRGADADVDGLALALAESAEPTDAPAEIEAEPGEDDRTPDAPFGGDMLDSEPSGDERFRDTESVGPEDSVRNPNDAGELGSFPEVYDEDMAEDENGDDEALSGDLPDENLDAEDPSETGESGEEDGSFGDFEAAFDADGDESGRGTDRSSDDREEDGA
jgi:flagellar protein FlaI